MAKDMAWEWRLEVVGYIEGNGLKASKDDTVSVNLPLPAPNTRVPGRTDYKMATAQKPTLMVVSLLVFGKTRA
jgi:hypothetical protein